MGEPQRPAWNWWYPVDKELATEWRTTPCVIDLNEDGLNDLVMLDFEGYLSFFERTKRDNDLLLLPGKRIFQINENSCVTDHTGRPVFVDIDKDEKNDLLLTAEDGFSFYYYKVPGQSEYILRSRDGVFTKKEEMKNSILQEENLNLLRLNAAWAGGSGRRKFCFGDWDRDGKIDLLVNSLNVNFLRNVADEKNNWIFSDEGPVAEFRACRAHKQPHSG